jgi:hypothetical protein
LTTRSDNLDPAKDACGRTGDAAYFQCMARYGYYWR